MNIRITLGFGLVLVGGLTGCNTGLHALSAPSAKQVQAWAGFPDDFPLSVKVESATNQSNESKSWFGTIIWECTYENPERSLVSLGISLSQPGTLWGTNHALLPKKIEEQSAKTRSLKDVKQFEKQAEQVIALPNGRKAYFTTLGFGPGGEVLAGFSYEQNYDLMVMEDFSTENGLAEKQAIPPARPTTDLPAIFKQVETFLRNQQ